MSRSRSPSCGVTLHAVLFAFVVTWLTAEPQRPQPNPSYCDRRIRLRLGANVPAAPALLRFRTKSAGSNSSSFVSAFWKNSTACPKLDQGVRGTSLSGGWRARLGKSPLLLSSDILFPSGYSPQTMTTRDSRPIGLNCTVCRRRQSPIAAQVTLYMRQENKPCCFLTSTFRT